MTKARRSLIRRSLLFWWQRQTRGWDDSDTWSLDYTLAGIIAPRLRRLREIIGGKEAPGDMDFAEWDVILSKMVAAFEWWADDPFIKVEPPEVKEGLALFAEHYGGLWT